MTIHRLRPGQHDDSEDRYLTPLERALTNVRLAAFHALECGATRQDVDREVAEAITARLRMMRGSAQCALARSPANQTRPLNRFETKGTNVTDMEALRQEVDRTTRRLLHTSQHDLVEIWLGGRIQDDINELRRAAGLPVFGWADAVPDEEVGRCTVHYKDCAGQHTHNPPVSFNGAR